MNWELLGAVLPPTLMEHIPPAHPMHPPLPLLLEAALSACPVCLPIKKQARGQFTLLFQEGNNLPESLLPYKKTSIQLFALNTLPPVGRKFSV